MKYVKHKILNHHMYISKSDKGIGSTLISGGGVKREEGFMGILRREAKQGMTCVDIGANIGFVSLILADIIGSTGQIWCIEPDPDNFTLLSLNMKENGYEKNSQLIQSGIGNSNGKLLFYRSDESNLGSMIPNHKTGSPINVEVITVDELFHNQLVTPNFYKMDVEGFEVEVLEGMYETLKRSNSPVHILMEVHPQFYTDKHSLEKQLRRLLDIGFKIKYVESAATPIPDKFAEKGYQPDTSFKLSKRYYRAVYSDIDQEDAIMFSSHPHRQYSKARKKWSDKIVRSILISKC